MAELRRPSKQVFCFPTELSEELDQTCRLVNFQPQFLDRADSNKFSEENFLKVHPSGNNVNFHLEPDSVKSIFVRNMSRRGLLIPPFTSYSFACLENSHSSQNCLYTIQKIFREKKQKRCSEVTASRPPRSQATGVPARYKV